MPKKATKKTATTQHSLNIAEIRDDCVVLRNGTLRAVLLVSSVNFALKSEDEQNAIIYSYISFLNSLDFPVQIVIQSRQLDIDNYLNEIKKAEKEQINELLKLQTSEYRQYIEELVELGDIMTKRFYVVVPYDPATDKKRGFWRRLIDLMSPAIVIHLKQKQFTEYHRQLFLRVDHILSGLASMSLRATVLDTQSLIELYYNSYNPEVSRQQKMTDVNKLKLENEI